MHYTLRGAAMPGDVWGRSEGGPLPAAATVFSPELLIFRLRAASHLRSAVDLRCVRLLTSRWREALLCHANDMPGYVRELISGHRSNGEPLERPHLTFLPMASVGHLHADGRVLGLAAVLPADLQTAFRRQVLQVLGRVCELRLGNLGVWHLAPGDEDCAIGELQPETWTAHPAGATHWATVTPIAFDRHPKEKDAEAYHCRGAAIVAASCAAVGLPQPREVVLTPASAHLGVPPACLFPRLTRKHGGERRHAHAILIFNQRVRGPLLIGAGRYRGYGVCRPINSEVL